MKWWTRSRLTAPCGGSALMTEEEDFDDDNMYEPAMA